MEKKYKDQFSIHQTLMDEIQKIKISKEPKKKNQSQPVTLIMSPRLTLWKINHKNKKVKFSITK